MQKKTSKTRFWLTLLTVNVLALIYPIGLLLNSEDDGARLFAVLLLMGSFIFMAVADTLSVVFAYWA